MAFFKEEHELLRKTVRDFTKNELLPTYKKRSKSSEFPWPLVKKMGQMGFFGVSMPAEYGGNPESDYVSAGILAEELGRGDPAMALWAGTAIQLGTILTKVNSDQVKNDVIPRVIKGEAAIAGAITEPECGSDALAMATTATKDGDSYILNGEKTSISWVGPAVGTLIWAKTSPGHRAKNVSIFYMPMNLPGIECNYFNDTGLKLISRASISMNNVRVPADYMIGGEGQGFYVIGERWEYIRVIDALTAIGAALQSIDETIEYIKNRKAFGQPLSKFQGVSFKIAEHATELEAGRLLSYNAMWRLDHHLDYFKESSMAKSWCLRLASDAVYDCLLFHGHYGYSEDLPFEQRLRDIIGLEIADAPPSLQKMILSRHLIGREWV